MKELLLVSLLLVSACRGTDGVNGSNGSNGIDGTNGTDASGVTVVQLCRGTTAYPSTFIEVGFCIQNRLYATYSANGGFSTEIVPGTYSSNAIGSNCTFTVAADCQVSN